MINSFQVSELVPYPAVIVIMFCGYDFLVIPKHRKHTLRGVGVSIVKIYVQSVIKLNFSGVSAGILKFSMTLWCTKLMKTPKLSG